MKILWISYIGSWTKPLAELIAKDNNIMVVVPSLENKEIIDNNVTYRYLNYTQKEAACQMTKSSFNKFYEIIKCFNPDIIHVHGTEKNLAQVQKYLPVIPVVTSIQGILMGCLPYTTNYLDKKIVKKYRTLKNILGFGGIRLMERQCKNGFTYEKDILENNQYFFGRTDFDKAHILMRNPNARYFFGGEILRHEFYENKGTWSIDACERHSIFMPAGFNPIKGMHFAIEAVGLLKRDYPNIRLYIPGILPSQSRKNYLTSIISGEEYIRYVYMLIRKFDISDNVVFLTRLNASQMVEHMKKAHVFLAASSIDNSPNAVGEATMIGCPVVTTPVGGIPSFIKDGINGLLSPAGDPYMLAYYIEQIFDNDQLASTISKNACTIASKLHDVDVVLQQYLSTYSKIIKIHREL